MKKKFKNLLIFVFIVSLSLLGIGYNEVSQVSAASPPTVDLGTAANYSILGETAITTLGDTLIIGNVGISPGTASDITGFGLTLDSSGTFSTSALVTGNIYASDYATSTPGDMTTAIDDMYNAYTDAAGRTASTTDTGVDAGILNSSTPDFVAGIYNWTNNVTITDSITLSGSATDIWIFQIAGDLDLAAAGDLASGTKILLTGGALAENVFWAVGGTLSPGYGVTLGAYSTFNGNILSAKQIILETGSELTGRALSQTQVTLDANTIYSYPATLRVVKLVVNDIDGIATSSDFSVSVKKLNVNVVGSPMLGTSTPGTLYSLAPGKYVIDEVANSSYTKSYSGECTATGTVTLLAGDDKTCIITNTSIPVVIPTPDPTPPSGSSGPVPITPLIGITKTSTPSVLFGSGLVTYNYTVWNVDGQRALASVVVTDDKCGPVTLISGDINKNFKIEPSEIWKYSCTANLDDTTTNTATATAKSDDPYQQTTTATAVATVVVGNPIIPVVITATSTPVSTATTTISSIVPTSTPPTLSVPKLPNTGVNSQTGNTSWNIIILSGIVYFASTFLLLILKKRKV